MAKKTTNNKVQTKKKTAAPKAPEAAPKATVAEEKVEVIETPVEEPVNVSRAADTKSLTSRKHSGLSMDGQVRLLDLARRTFVEETDPDLQFPQQTRIAMNKVVAVGIICTLAEHAEAGENQYAAVLKTNAYPALENAALEMGIKLPKVALLAAPEGDPEAVVLPADKIKVSKETKEQLKKEKNIKEGEQPELDPEKISSDEDLKKALEYMFTNTRGKSLSVTITEAIDFMKKFRLHEASQAENKDEATARFESYNSGDWLDDIFGYFKPTVFFTGIGRGMESVAAAEKSPVHAFIILRDAIKNKETGEPALPDSEIAHMAKSIVKWVAGSCIESNHKAIEALDKKTNVAEIKSCETAIRYHEDVLKTFTDPSFEEAENYLRTESEKLQKLGNSVIKSYYGAAAKVGNYKNLKTNVQQRIGVIINLFAAPGSQNLNYSESNISDLVEYTKEELDELKKAEAKAKKQSEEEASKKG